MTNFQRSYSRVWWANDTADDSQNRVYFYGPNASRPLSNIAEESPPYHSSNIRRSVRSHDSGFNDSDQSPNTTANSSQISAHSDDSPKSDENQNYLSPQNSSNSSLSTNRSTNDTIPTPPTVIRKKKTTFRSPIARRISFSAPNSPEMDAASLNSSFRSLDSFSMKTSKKSDADTTLVNGKPKSSTLSRGRTISPHDGSIIRRKASRRRILDCVSQVSGSTSDIYTLASNESHGCQSDGEEGIYHHYESLIEVQQAVAEHDKSTGSNSSYHNETVTFGEAEEVPAPPTPRRPLPIYDELYAPNGCSTPKMPRMPGNVGNVSQLSDHTQSSIVALNGASSHYELGPKFNPNLSESVVNLSLRPNLTWNDCTYTEYTNPLLNGNDCSVQFWLDETRSSYCHEVTSMLQTKSVLYEAAKSLKLNPAIASKLIRQIQLKAITIETQFDDIERVFDAHAKLVQQIRNDDSVTNCENEIEIADNKCKEKISLAMKSLTSKVCQFMSKLNSKIIFQSLPGCAANRGDLKSFEYNVKTVIDMCQDLRVACDTKIDDIETNVLLRDFYTLKQSVLKVIRKVFRRLVQIIVSRIEENSHELLLRTYINMITNLPAESVYNSHERFSSLNDAFIVSGIIRVFLLICLDSEKIDIRASSLRALATICSSAEMIRQFIEIGGLDVITDILTDDKRSNYHFEPELREAVSVLTQVTAPWHHGDSGNIDDLLKLSIDRLVTRLTVLIEDTECLQTLMLSIACLNNLSHKSSLTFYSIMDNCSVPKIIRACERYNKRNDFQQSAIFLYVSTFSMIFFHGVFLSFSSSFFTFPRNQ